MSIEPFTIEVPEQEVRDLRSRIAQTRWPDEISGAGWSYGIPVERVRELAEHWHDRFDWRAAEAELNRWPQHVTEIDGARIHFADVPAATDRAMPLLLCHGWPGSFAEFLDLAPLLTGGTGGDAGGPFRLIIPSLPGFGFSGPTTDRGWEHRRIATAFAELMRRLGHDRYLVHGGDWGAAIARELGRIDPDHVVGVHLTLVPGTAMSEDPDAAGAALLPPEVRQRARSSWAREQEWEEQRSAYAALQSTRPQTAAFALTDSPVGLLAWIAEKFDEWSDRRLTREPIDRDRLLTDVSIYWFTRTIGSSMRIYHERAHAPYWGTPEPVSQTPTALALFPEENFVIMRHLVEQSNRLVRWTELDHGGHFAALEQPGALAADLRAFERHLRSLS